MVSSQLRATEPVFLSRESLGRLIGLLGEEGYTVIAPVREDDVIRLRPITSLEALPQGVSDEQEGGCYRLADGDGEMVFGYVVGPDSAKRYLFPPQQRLFRMHVEGDRFVLDAGPPQPPKLAFLGLRPCDLSAIAVQDRVFNPADDKPFRCESETYYSETRKAALLIAVNCTQPGGTCFCASMGTGPQATEGYDLAMTEIRAGFVVDAGSDKGAAMLGNGPVRATTTTELELAQIKLRRAAEHMGRELDTAGVEQLLADAVEHPHWNAVAQRCLGCGNCTMVCPTCFCSTVTDASDLSGEHVERTRQWESCFTHQFSYTTSGPVRPSVRGRYRHWLRHKLSTWWKQFGVSGCVGCGRCITWCPVGIDLTAEVRAIREGPPRAATEPPRRVPVAAEKGGAP